MARDTDIPRRLAAAGLEVDYVHGWQTRGADALSAGVHVNHHTAGGINGTQPSLNICINGRSDLPGPLCNVFLPREESRRVIVVAAGRANHAGKGGWAGLSGNSRAYGVEVEHVGTGAEGLSALRYDNMVRVAAAMALGRFGADRVCQHREWAPGRKPDFTVVHIPDGNRFRADVQNMLNAIEGGTVPPSPQPQPQPDPGGAPILRRGSKGNDVRWVQERLNAHSINDGRLRVVVDGDFGPATEKAVKFFQSDVHLAQDGIVGPRTRGALATEPNRPTPPPPPPPPPDLQRDRIRRLQSLTGSAADGIWGPNTEARINANLIGWKKNLPGNSNRELVRFLQQQGNRRFNNGMAEDGLVGPATNHLIVVQLGQRDGIAGPNAWRQAIR